jgi:hypothetical protein
VGQKEQGGILKLEAVVDMVLNFLITDKRIMAERSSVPRDVKMYQCANNVGVKKFYFG